ncbi:MAG: zinc ABC transporter substrate-binding protein [Bacteroidetes bacterium]|nr:zinc ABC transporter substrate-binding protein [Bacteroidota bacterium]
MKKIISLSVLMLFVSIITQPQTKKVKVVTTLNYLKYVTEQIGGNNVSVIALANPKQDPHYVTPTPRMNAVTTDADLFIENGMGLDQWAKNVVDASGNPKVQAGTSGHLTATLNVPVKELPTEVSRAWGDIHPQGNPHVWLDPLNIKIIAENIAGSLKTLDPANAAYYLNNLQHFKEQIDAAMFGEALLKAVGKKAGDILSRKTKTGELTAWLQTKKLNSKLGGWMKTAQSLAGKKVITYHKTYIYFAERFGIDLAGELEEKPGIPPPPQHRDAVVELVKREHITTILNDNFYSTEAAEYVSSKTGAKVAVTYIDVYATTETETYEGLISTLLQNLSGTVR